MVAFGTPVVPEVKPSRATSSRPVRTASKRPICRAHAVKFGVVVGGAVEADHLFEEAAVLGAGDHLVHQARVAQRQRDLGLVDDLGEFAGPQHRHGVDHDRAGLGGASQQATIAGLLAERISTRLPGFTP